MEEDEIDYTNDYNQIDYDVDEGTEDYSNTLALQRKNTSISIVLPNELIQIRERLIKDCCEATSLNRDDAITVLIFYKWNLDKVNQEWFEDVDKNRKNFGIDLSDKAKIELENKNVETNSPYCLVCYSDIDESNSFKLACGHNFCDDCWKQFICTKIEDVFCCLFSTCMQQNCNLRIPESIFKKYLKDNKDNMEKFEKIVLRNFTENNSDLKWCPKDCGKCVRTENHSSMEIECECMYVYCFSCLREGHRPCPCEYLEAWEHKNNSEGENMKWILVYTKSCPSCRKPIEKNQGCNHMTCNKNAGGCGYEFCWICMGEWKPHSNSYYKCNFYDEKKIKKDENNLEVMKNELQKYSFYYNRYVNHKKTRDFVTNMVSSILESQKKLIDEHNSNFIDTQFLWEGYNTIQKGLRVLMNTYVFGFYMKNNCTLKNLFEYNQYLLERSVDFLVEKLEDNKQLNEIFKIKEFDSFNSQLSSYRDTIKNKAVLTNNYIDNVLREIEEKMMNEMTNLKTQI